MRCDGVARTDARPRLTDGLGRTVNLTGARQRIVSLAPSNTEILFAVGAGAQVVGRDSFSDYPAEAKSVQDIGGSMGEYNTEAIVALHPDLVLAGEINTPELVTSLEKLGLTVYYLPNPDHAGRDVRQPGNGRPADRSRRPRPPRWSNSLKARVAAVDAKIATLTVPPNRLLRTGCHRPDQALYRRPRHLRRPADRTRRRDQCRREPDEPVGADQPGAAAGCQPVHHPPG